MTPWAIRDRATFESLRRSRWRARRGSIAVAHLPGDPGARPRVAYAVGRQVGNAVGRNRVRRRLRPLVAELALAPGAYLISAGADALTADVTTLRHELADAVDAATAAARAGRASP